MITERWINENDYSPLKDSLAKDEYHRDTRPDFFYTPGTVCKVYEDEKGPIMYVRGCKSLRIDIQFFSNHDYERNREVLTTKFKEFVNTCKASGFKELVFNTDSPLLKRFCIQKLNFFEVSGELRYSIG